MLLSFTKNKKKSQFWDFFLFYLLIQHNIPQRDVRSQGHSFYDCKYHIVFTPKYRRKVFISKYIKEEIWRIIKLICKYKWIEILEWYVSTDHIHLLLIIPLKYSVSYVMQIIKWKSSAWIKKKNKNIKIKSKKHEVSGVDDILYLPYE